jgi:type I restriction enzyme, S subunit
MINDLAPYPKMMDSGVLWLGQVPAHWEMRRIKTLFREKDQRNGDGDGLLLSLTRARGIIPQAEASKRIASAEDLSKYKVCRVGDLVMNRMQAWSGMFAVSPQEGVVSPDYSVFGPIAKLNMKYFEYLFKTPLLVGQFAQRSKGIGSGFNRLYTPDFGSIPVAVPPVPEQTATVRFLEHADARIRRYISAKQKLIKLLEEEKRSTIFCAVTRGLDPNVRFKPSGVECMGDVPEQWEVVPFKRRVGFQEGPGIMAADFRDDGVPLLRISCLEGDVASLNGCNFLEPEMVKRRWAHFAIKNGDYLLSASASTGNVVLATDVVAGSIPYTGILRLWPISKEVSMPFIRLYMTSAPFQAQIDIAKSGVGIEHFGPTHLKRMVISMPPLAEQMAIVTAVEEQIAPLGQAIERARREIEFVREFRNSLVATVVTGKLDVREASARLPKEAPEVEPLDEIEDMLEDDRTVDEELEAADAA